MAVSAEMTTTKLQTQMNRRKELEDIIKKDILHGERKVKNTTVNVHILGRRPHEELIAEILAGQNKYEKFPRLKQPNYLHHLCVRGGPPTKRSPKHIGCKAYLTFKKLTHPMGGNVLIVTEKNIHTGHDPDNCEDTFYQMSPNKRKRLKTEISVFDLMEKGWMEKVTSNGNGFFSMPLETDETKSYNIFFPELSCPCRLGKRPYFCPHLDLLMRMQEDKHIESLSDLMQEEARNILTEEEPRYTIMSREAGEVSVFVPSHKTTVHCSLSRNSCTCPAYAFSGACSHLHLASYVFPDFGLDTSLVKDNNFGLCVTEKVTNAHIIQGNEAIAEEVAYSAPVSEEVILNTSQTSSSYIAKLRDVIYYLEAASPTQEIATLIDDLHSQVKDSFVYVVPVDSL